MKDIVNRLTKLKIYKTKINIKFLIISSIYLLICSSCLPWNTMSSSFNYPVIRFIMNQADPSDTVF